MSKEGLSRRSFLRNTAVGTTGAALASLPAAHAAAEAAARAPWPVTEESYPLTAPGNAASQARMKLVTDLEFPRAYQEKLQAYAPNLEIKTCGTREEFRQQVADAHIIFGGCNKEEFLSARQLRWIQYPAAGVEGILFPDLVESPVVLTNMQRMYSPTISETVIGLLITLTRRLNDYTLQTRERRWNALEGLTEISGLTMGIVGMGGIGTDTAYRAHYGFHMRILATDPKPLPKPAFVAELHSPEWLPKMVPQVDVLLSAAPHTPLTHHMFNDRDLPLDEAQRLLYQCLAWLVGGLVRPGQRPERTPDRRRRARRHGTGTAAPGSPFVDGGQHHHHFAHVRGVGRFNREITGPLLRERTALHERPAPAQRRGQETGILAGDPVSLLVPHPQDLGRGSLG